MFDGIRRTFACLNGGIARGYGTCVLFLGAVTGEGEAVPVHQ